MPSEASTTEPRATHFGTNDKTDIDPFHSKLQEQLSHFRAQLRQLNTQRRQLLNDFLDLKGGLIIAIAGNIRVFCRIRPVRTGETLGPLTPLVVLDSSNLLLKLADNKSKRYSFDQVFYPESSQDQVFSEVEPLIKSVIDGYNACIFAYGQTGTGKTFTMEGTPDSPGIVPRAVEALFKQAMDSNHAFLINFSMLEVYLGNLRDLLVTQQTTAADSMPPCLSIQTDLKGGIAIDNLLAIQVSDFTQALKLYQLGCQFRSTAPTNSNMTSSRSHCLIRISITCFDAPERRRETNKLWLVDLGGSERVLKTKAWGRRFDEGKSINLSLSALGDVINALQRKKGHIPYRNSKLTQVLKDSLGADSKTLMLVHVSPTEEDACETTCSLNFAMRVKSIHLGHEDSKEERNYREVVMKDLSQRMKNIEDQRQNIVEEIKKLNEKVENLRGTALSSEEILEASYLCAEDMKGRVGDVREAPSSQLPRFMKPTICSRRKSGDDMQTSGGSDVVPERRRRPTSHHAESVSFPAKKNSGYNSGCSISRSTCLLDKNMKSNADNETEYSQGVYESDTKLVASEEPEELQETTIQQRAHVNHLDRNGNRKTNKCNSTKMSRVVNWLQLHKNEPTISSYNQRKKHICEGWSKVEICDEKVTTSEFTEKQVEVEEVECSISKIKINKRTTMLKDLFDKQSRSNIIFPSLVPNGQMMIQTKDSSRHSSKEKSEFETLSPVTVGYGGCSHYKDDHGVHVMLTMEKFNDGTQCSGSFMPENWKCQFSLSNLDNSFNSKRDHSASISIHRQQTTEIDVEDGGKEMNDNPQLSPRGIRQGQLKLTSQSTDTDNANQKDPTETSIQAERTSNEKGICHMLEQKIKILFASALLGLGFHDLGLGHEFFHGLML